MATIDESLRRVPPQSLEAEEAVLGGILLDNAALDRVTELVQADDFYREAHRKVFRAMLDLSARNEPADLITLAEVLKARSELADVGGSAYLAELAERVPTAAHVAQYARIVRDKSTLRGLIGAATQIAMHGYESGGAPGGSARAILELLRARAGRLLARTDPGKAARRSRGACGGDRPKPVYEVTARLGRKVRTTGTRPFLPIEGGSTLGEVRPGDDIT